MGGYFISIKREVGEEGRECILYLKKAKSKTKVSERREEALSMLFSLCLNSSGKVVTQGEVGEGGEEGEGVVESSTKIQAGEGGEGGKGLVK